MRIGIKEEGEEENKEEEGKEYYGQNSARNCGGEAIDSNKASLKKRMCKLKIEKIIYVCLLLFSYRNHCI